ncbi:MAG: GrpB family protein, partial [Candidatus Dormibacteraeota bacterium]|nr:GrpB family protein [Candidatus Dormibacteraeota bacterium]
YSAGCPEIERYVAFRDRLRAVPEEREEYERVKVALAKRRWRYMQQYADAKSNIMEAIIERAVEAAR